MSFADIALPSVRLLALHSGRSDLDRDLAEQVARGARGVPGAQAQCLSLEAVASCRQAIELADVLVLICGDSEDAVTILGRAFEALRLGPGLAPAWRGKLAAGLVVSRGAEAETQARLQALLLFAARQGLQWVASGICDSSATAPMLAARGSRPGAPAMPHAATAGDALLRSAEDLGAHAARRALERRPGGEPEWDGARQAIAAVLMDYFDGLYFCSVERLQRAFHPAARYVNATDGGLPNLGLEEYLPIVAARQSPASRGEPRRDRILSIDFAGPHAALARVECAIGPKRFVDLLTLMHSSGQWRIISKVFHYTVSPDPVSPETTQPDQARP
jgi:hypothetical protein